MKARTMLAINETPDRVHGRLLESVHLAGYTFGRACDELKWLLRQDRWQSVSPGFNDINDFLGTMDFSTLRAARDERRDLVRQLNAVQARQRAVARLLGIDKETVARDLGLRGANAPPNEAVSPTVSEESSEFPDISGANAPV